MGGGAVLYLPLPMVELESWGRVSGNQPTVWELQTLRDMSLAFVAAKNNNGTTAPQLIHQAIGDYCHGESVEKCRATFGESLETICRTCPN